MSILKETYLVKKRNILNEIRANSMTLQELRFFSIYLSKINPNDSNTRVVRFSIFDFQRIMDLGRINIDYLKQVTNSLLCKVVNVPNERGGYSGFQLFKECTVDTDEKGKWYVEIDAHDKALPLLFDYKNRYFSYQLWNALRLKSSNQLRMYEILKQYETIGTRIFSVEELRNLLGIDKKEYKAYKDFRVRVLDSCQTALNESTDIRFTYEFHGRRGPGGKILFLKFTIKKNTNYVNPLALDEFINLQNGEDVYEVEPLDYADADDRPGIDFNMLSEAFSNEFSREEVEYLYHLALPYVLYKNPRLTLTSMPLIMYDYFILKYSQLNANARTVKKSRYGLLRSFIESDTSPISQF